MCLDARQNTTLTFRDLNLSINIDDYYSNDNMAANAIQNVIPLRVDLKKAIEIAQSQLDISGRGLFAKEDVKAGELIFCIPQPLIVSVSWIQSFKDSEQL